MDHGRFFQVCLKMPFGKNDEWMISLADQLTMTDGE